MTGTSRPEGGLGRAQELLDLGSALRRVGRDEEAREPLREALHLAHRHRDTGLEQRVRDELIAAGGRPRRAALSGVAALTPGERRVAEMAAAGMSNREIAETLYVTMKAVQWHLRHVYRKLGVTDRTEIGACLDEESAPSDA